jgi:hypothetical protein
MHHIWIIAAFIISILIFASLLHFTLFNATYQADAASWNQIWGDDFNGNAGTGVDPANWLYDTGTGYAGGAPNWGTGEIEIGTNSTNNVYLDGNGHLVIKPINSNGIWTSGRIETQRTDFAAPVGGQLAVEASIQQPNVSGPAAAGYWPAFWMLAAATRPVGATNWPGVGEIDILEDINGLSSEFGTLHCGTISGGPCNETTGIGSGKRECSGCQTAYHTYRVEVDRSVAPEQIRWFLDGVNFFTVNASQFDATTWTNAVDHSFFIILNVAIGGAFPAIFGGGPTSATQSGIPMNVDYVHVFTSQGSTPTPMSTTMLTNPPMPIPTTMPTNPPMPIPTTIPTNPPMPIPTTMPTNPPMPMPATIPTNPPASTSCTGTFSAGVVNSSTTTALPWFQPCGWTAGYVIIHYMIGGNTQQNIKMTYNSGTNRWESTVNDISVGQVLTYSYTYQKDELQHDTETFKWTHP